MNQAALALDTSMVHPVGFRCLWMTKAATQRMENAANTKSATDNPTIQSMRVITDQYELSAR